MSGELFTLQADFQGAVYNATHLSKILNNGEVQNLEFFVTSTPFENITVGLFINNLEIMNLISYFGFVADYIIKCV